MRPFPTLAALQRFNSARLFLARFRLTIGQIAVAGLLATGALCQAAQTLTVTNTSDNVATPADGSLRKAITDSVAGDAIEFQAGLTGTIALAGAELLLDKDLTITGPGATVLAVSGNQLSRIFRIPAGKTVTISGLTIHDGKAPNGENQTAYDLAREKPPANPGGDGGGILNAGFLTLNACSLTNNTAGQGGVVRGTMFPFWVYLIGKGGSGGAISNSGMLTLSACKVTGNRAGGGLNVEESGVSAGSGGDGGGVHSSAGALNMVDTSIDQNAAGDGGTKAGTNSGRAGDGGAGGGISIVGGTALIERCSITANHGGRGGDYGIQDGTLAGVGGYGGGIATASAAVELKNCTIIGNSAGDVSPYHYALAGVGGGLVVSSGSLELNSCTISGNIAGKNSYEGSAAIYGVYDGSGGGIVNAGTLTIRNTIVAANKPTGHISNQLRDDYPDVWGTFVSAGHNLIGAGDGGIGFTHGLNGDIVGTVASPVDPRLGAMADYGGLTPTAPLVLSSPAIDAGDDSITGTDQRGSPRLSGAHVDIGAFEGAFSNTFSFAAAKVEAQESQGILPVVVRRTGDIASAASVQFSMSGTAIPGTDYIAPPNTVDFAPGQAEAVINFSIIGDLNPEGPKWIQFQLNAPALNTALYPNATVTIALNDDDGTGILSFTTATSRISESGGSVVVTVQRKNGAMGSVSIDYSTGEGLQQDGDFTPVTGTLVFSEGVAQQSFAVPIVNDTKFEGDDTFFVRLSGPTGGATLGTPLIQLITIENDDPIPPPPPQPTFDFQVAASSVSESGGNVLIKVIRSKVTSGNVSVSYQTNAGTAAANEDFISSSGVLNFPSNSTEQTIVVPITNDTVFEGSETFTVTLSNPVGVLGTVTTHTVTILEDDPAPPPPPTFDFQVATSIGSESGGNLLIKVIRSFTTSGAVSVSYQTVAGTAAADADFTPTTGVLNFPDGSTEQTIVVPITNDTVFEGSETFTVTLSNPVGGVLGTVTTHTVTILDDDGQALVAFASGSSSVDESTGVLNVSLIRSGNTASEVSIQVSANSGTALLGPDYSFQPITVTFSPGSVEQTVAISIVNDTVEEADEEFSLVLSNPNGGALGSQTSHTVTIFDDSEDLPQIQRASYRGLVIGTGEATPEYGAIVVAATDKGQLTGTLKFRGKNLRLKGKFSERGAFSQAFLKGSLEGLAGSALQLTLADGAATLRGTFEIPGGTILEVEAKRDIQRSRRNPVDSANAYTALLKTTLPNNPAGCLRASVLPTGKVVLSGILPDGTRLSASSHLAEDRTFPIFFPAYAKKLGYLAGSAAFDLQASTPLAGDLHWKKPAGSKAPYSVGLTDEEVELSGFVYTAPHKQRILNDYDAGQGAATLQISETGGVSAAEIPLSWSQNNVIRLASPGVKTARVVLQPHTGLFSGSFRDSAGQKRQFHGICLQLPVSGEDLAAGFFLSEDGAGRVEIVPQR